MLTIWKFPILGASVGIRMPSDARVLHVDLQSGSLTLWALVYPDAATEIRHFRVYGTGRPIELFPERQYVGTVFQGAFVWHVFEEEDEHNRWREYCNDYLPVMEVIGLGT